MAESIVEFFSKERTKEIIFGLEQNGVNMQGSKKDEFLNIMTVGLEELVQDIMQGKIIDGKTQVALLKVYHMMGENGLYKRHFN